VNWVPVKSRMLLAVSYDHDWCQLYLKFRSGDIYCYRGVPVERYEELLAADSKGKYCRSHILNRFPYERVLRTVRTARLSYIFLREIGSPQNPSNRGAANLQAVSDFGLTDTSTV
jgi:hypothetical protein